MQKIDSSERPFFAIDFPIPLPHTSESVEFGLGRHGCLVPPPELVPKTGLLVQCKSLTLHTS